MSRLVEQKAAAVSAARQEPAKIVHDVYSTGDQAALNSYYRDWAGAYDSDVVERMGYTAPSEAAEVLAEWLPGAGEAHVLDAGAGTGLVGEALKSLGFTRIDALDASQEMLDVAGSKGVYSRLIRAELGPDRLDLGDATYDGLICVGTFTFGHVKADAFDELLRILKPGGLFCFTHRTDVYADPSLGFERRQADLSADGAWELLFKSEARPYLPRVDPKIRYNTWLYRKASQPAANDALR